MSFRMADHSRMNIQGCHDEASKPRKAILWLFEKPYVKTTSKKIKEPCTDWSIYRASNKEIGSKMYFSCNKIKPSKEIVSESLFLLYDSVSERVLRLRTSKNQKFDCDRELTTEVKAEIAKLFRLNMKPKSVLNSLFRMNPFPLPTKSQLATYITQLIGNQTKKIDKVVKETSVQVDIEPQTPRIVTKVINLKTLDTILCRHLRIPEDEHESFVVAQELDEHENADSTFRFFISTRHLIGLAAKAKIIHVSAAFHLSWQTFPMFIMGTTDKDNAFHPFGLSIADHLHADDFIYFFNVLKDSVKEIHMSDMNPSFLMCNAEEPIQQAFMNVFGPYIHILTCWSHVRKQIIKNVMNLIEPPKRMEILSDIDTLQLAARHDIFQQARNHFLRKWKREVAFCNYLEKEWINHNQNWYEGAAQAHPSTNNALEAFYINVRNNLALQNEFRLQDSLDNILEMVSDWSNEYRQGLKRVASTPTISQRLWIDSYQWFKMPKNIMKCKNRKNCSIYRIPFSNKRKELSDKNSETWFFNIYKEQHQNECEVALPLGIGGWMKGSCNCPTFLKTFMCKHILGMAITLKEVKVPPEIRRESIGDSCKQSKIKTHLT